jgi:1-acyl-sn-glycerol-3-phosphate acyltransferase
MLEAGRGEMRFDSVRCKHASAGDLCDSLSQHPGREKLPLVDLRLGAQAQESRDVAEAPATVAYLLDIDTDPAPAGKADSYPRATVCNAGREIRKLGSIVNVWRTSDPMRDRYCFGVSRTHRSRNTPQQLVAFAPDRFSIGSRVVDLCDRDAGRVGVFCRLLWRLFATVLSFTVFGFGGLIMGLLLFPLLFVFTRDRERRTLRARRLIGRAFGGFWGMMNVLGILDYEIQGRSRIEDGHNRLIVANHPTLIDVVILISLFPLANCVIKEAVSQNIFMRSVVRAAEYLSNSEPEQLLESCVTYLKSGGSLMLFPEGTRTTQGQNIDFKPGAATVAARAGVEVLPVAIKCDPLFLSKEHLWHHVPQRRPVFKINILEPIRIDTQGTDPRLFRRERHELNKKLLQEITEALARMEFSEKANYNT